MQDDESAFTETTTASAATEPDAEQSLTVNMDFNGEFVHVRIKPGQAVLSLFQGGHLRGGIPIESTAGKNGVCVIQLDPLDLDVKETETDE